MGSPTSASLGGPAMKSRRCRYCRHEFIPDPRTPHQQVCRRKTCRRKRKTDSQARWLANSPDYFKGPDQYLRTKAWLAKHPGYLRRYRAKHPAYVAADNRKRRERKLRQKADMKDAILRREIGRIRGLSGADIQDTIRLRLDGILDVLPVLARADMQDSMAGHGPLSLPYSP